MQLDDKPLVLAFQSGEEYAFVSLYNRYKNGIYAFCMKMLMDEDLAREVLQETFVRAFENRQRLAQAQSFRSWLFAIARNQCLNQLRRAERLVSWSVGQKGEPRVPEQETPFGHLEKSERVALVNRFLNELKPEYREVLVLREYQNLSYAEIAAITRNTESSVKSRLFKARKKMAAFLGPWISSLESKPVSTIEAMHDVTKR